MPGLERPELMNRPTSPGEAPAAPHLFAVLALLWLGGAAIRIPLLAVPPIIPLIHDDLHMSETQVGLLIGMPLAMFALAAVPGSLLIARLGALNVAAAGLGVAALAAAARAAAFDVWTLYATTLLMGFGVAIFQPALPTLVRLWAPARTWLANAFSTNGMLVGATLSSALTIPVVLPLIGASWRLDVLIWSVPGCVAALLYAVAAPRPKSAEKTAEAAVQLPPARWWPDWSSPTLWLLGIGLGANNALFFASNAFVPDYLTSTGRSDTIGMTLACLNASQLIGSFVMLAMPERLQRGSWPFTVFGPITTLGLLGIVFCDGVWILLSAAAAGLGAAVTFIVTFGLPAVLSPPGEVHRMAGGMFTISYSIAVIVPVLCGAAWDLTGLPWTAFLPMALCAVAMTIFGTALTRRGKGGASASNP
jgi:CP family cyanate transporter-like MFS transporter